MINYDKEEKTQLCVEDILNDPIRLGEVYKDYKYFPMNLLMNDDTHMHFVLGLRGDGKTYNAKKFIVEDWFERKMKSYWLVPFEKDALEMKRDCDFHLDMIIDDLVDGYITREEAIENGYSEQDLWVHDKIMNGEVVMDGAYLKDLNGDWFMKIVPLSKYANHKKGRHPRVHRIYFDEFMREKYLPEEATKIMDFLVSVQREKRYFKFIFLGNAISIYQPILHALGVHMLEDDLIVNTFSDDQGKLFKVWNWKKPREISEAKNGDLLWFRLGEITGYNKYAVDNEFKNDNMKNIVDFDQEAIDEYLEWMYTIQVSEKQYAHIYLLPKEYVQFNDPVWNPNGGDGNGCYEERKPTDVLWCELTEDYDINKVIYTPVNRFVKDGVEYRPDMLDGLLDNLQKDRIWYKNVATKYEIYNVTKNNTIM